jgi:hypothetical protein
MIWEKKACSVDEEKMPAQLHCIIHNGHPPTHCTTMCALKTLFGEKSNPDEKNEISHVQIGSAWPASCNGKEPTGLELILKNKIFFIKLFLRLPVASNSSCVGKGGSSFCAQVYLLTFSLSAVTNRAELCWVLVLFSESSRRVIIKV